MDELGKARRRGLCQSVARLRCLCDSCLLSDVTGALEQGQVRLLSGLVWRVAVKGCRLDDCLSISLVNHEWLLLIGGL